MRAPGAMRAGGPTCWKYSEVSRRSGGDSFSERRVTRVVTSTPPGRVMDSRLGSAALQAMSLLLIFPWPR